MSRIGQSPVTVPPDVEVRIAGQRVTAKGKQGELGLTLVDEVGVERQDDKLIVTPRSQSKRARAMWGTSRSLLDNLVAGVDRGFTVELEINGTGYRASVDGGALLLQLGYSHEVRFAVPDGISIRSDRPTHIAVFGADRQRVGQVAAEIRAFRKPEPYKGKGIRYARETLIRKEGKKK